MGYIIWAILYGLYYMGVTYVINFTISSLMRSTACNVCSARCISVDLKIFVIKCNDFIDRKWKRQPEVGLILTSNEVLRSFSWLSDPLWQKWSVISNQTWEINVKKSSMKNDRKWNRKCIYENLLFEEVKVDLKFLIHQSHTCVLNRQCWLAVCA